MYSTEGSLLPSRMISKSWSSWITCGRGQCVTVWVSLDQSSKPIGSASQTQGRSQECYLWVSHHIKGMSGYYSSHVCSADICCFLWQLPSCNCPFTDSGKTERKRETARNNEAWDQLAQQAFGFSVTVVPLNDCQRDPCHGRVLDGLDKS